MHDLELEAYAKAKLRAVRQETKYYGDEPKRSWRSRTAYFLRGLADGLESRPAPVPASRLQA